MKWSEADALFLAQHQQHSIKLERGLGDGFHKPLKEYLSKNTESHSQEINMGAQTYMIVTFQNQKETTQYTKVSLSYHALCFQVF